MLVCSISLDPLLRIGVLGVAKITNDCVYVHAVCVAWRTCPFECVSVFSSDIRVVFALGACPNHFWKN